MPAGDGGLGASLVGEKLLVGKRNLSVSKLLGEGEFPWTVLPFVRLQPKSKLEKNWILKIGILIDSLILALLTVL